MVGTFLPSFCYYKNHQSRPYIVLVYILNWWFKPFIERFDSNWEQFLLMSTGRLFWARVMFWSVNGGSFFFYKREPVVSIVVYNAFTKAMSFVKLFVMCRPVSKSLMLVIPQIPVWSLVLLRDHPFLWQLTAHRINGTFSSALVFCKV